MGFCGCLPRYARVLPHFQFIAAPPHSTFPPRAALLPHTCAPFIRGSVLPRTRDACTSDRAVAHRMRFARTTLCRSLLCGALCVATRVHTLPPFRCHTARTCLCCNRSPRCLPLRLPHVTDRCRCTVPPARSIIYVLYRCRRTRLRYHCRCLHCPHHYVTCRCCCRVAVYAHGHVRVCSAVVIVVPRLPFCLMFVALGAHARCVPHRLCGARSARSATCSLSLLPRRPADRCHVTV